MADYSVTDGQSLGDIALTVYGDVDGVAWLLADNPDLRGPAERLRVGQRLHIRVDSINQQAQRRLQDFAVLAKLKPGDQAQGVGFDYVGETPVSSGIADAVNMSPLATNIHFSSVSQYFHAPHRIMEAVLPSGNWGDFSWNDDTIGAWPDWIELVWPTPIEVMGAQISHLANSQTPGINPTENGMYVLKDFRFEVWTDDAFQTVLSVAGNTKVYTVHEFPGVYPTTRVRLWITQATDVWSRVCQLKIMGR